MGRMKAASRTPDLTHINADIAAIERVNAKIQDQAAALRDLIKSKQDVRGYNSVALGMLRRIASMSDEKFADFYRTFEGGLEQVVAERRGQMTPDMDFDQGEELEDNVVPFGEEPVAAE